MVGSMCKPLHMLDYAHRDGELGFGGWVNLSVPLELPPQLKDSLTAAMDLRWVMPSSQLEGLPNGSERSVNRLRSNSVAAAESSLPDPVSKTGEDCGSLLVAAIVEVCRDSPLDLGVVAPVLPVRPSPRLVHCAIVNRCPRRVEMTFKTSSVGRITTLQDRFCGKGKLDSK